MSFVKNYLNFQQKNVIKKPVSMFNEHRDGLFRGTTLVNSTTIYGFIPSFC